MKTNFFVNIFFRKICRSIYHLESESLELMFVEYEKRKEKYENEIIVKSEKSPKWSEKEKSLNVNEKHLLFTSEEESMKMKTNGEIKLKILLKSTSFPIFHCDLSESTLKWDSLKQSRRS